jgi:outer membrane protein OmpA-like peptidoglycan-associated protein
MLAGCAPNPSIVALQTATLKGDAYQTALANAYREDAAQRANEGDAELASYFANKGLMAARGQDIAPENPAGWNIAAPYMEELVAARDTLLHAIPANRATQPEMAAAAVLAYDRWVVLQHQGASETQVEEQATVFRDVLAKLTEAYAAASNAPTTTTPPESSASVIYFPLDSDALGDSAKAALAGLVRDMHAAKATHLNVNGHADRLGSEEYNMDLSERRARAVVKALKEAGVPAKLLQYFAFGESDPAVPTADEVAEPRNRRVEIHTQPTP